MGFPLLNYSPCRFCYKRHPEIFYREWILLWQAIDWLITPLPLLILWLTLQMGKSLKILQVISGLHKHYRSLDVSPSYFTLLSNPRVTPQKPAGLTPGLIFALQSLELGRKYHGNRLFLWGLRHFLLLILARATTSPVIVIASWHAQSQCRAETRN